MKLLQGLLLNTLKKKQNKTFTQAQISLRVYPGSTEWEGNLSRSRPESDHWQLTIWRGKSIFLWSDGNLTPRMWRAEEDIQCLQSLGVSKKIWGGGVRRPKTQGAPWIHNKEFWFKRWKGGAKLITVCRCGVQLHKNDVRLRFVTESLWGKPRTERAVKGTGGGQERVGGN